MDAKDGTESPPARKRCSASPAPPSTNFKYNAVASSAVPRLQQHVWHSATRGAPLPANGTELPSVPATARCDDWVVQSSGSPNPLTFQ